MSTAPDLAEFDAMLDATLATLARRAAVDADGGEVSFGVGDDVGGIVRVGRDVVERLEDLLSIFVDDQVIETGEGPLRIRSRVSWRGDTTSELPPGVTAAQVAAHVAATVAVLEERARRLHGLAMMLSTAGRIAGMFAVPGGAVMVLPIAYECVRDLHRRWSGSRSKHSNQEQGTRGAP
ncbi:MAG: hypothetical protein KDK70_28140 [Myxococcales bacterium]|nr:hypothetical protein [Myxococcales bacterium]